MQVGYRMELYIFSYLPAEQINTPQSFPLRYINRIKLHPFDSRKKWLHMLLANKMNAEIRILTYQVPDNGNRHGNIT